MSSSQREIIQLVGEENTYKHEPFSDEEEMGKARYEKKWIIQNRERFFAWERLENWKYTSALSTTLAFENDSLIEVAVYWNFNHYDEANFMYEYLLHQTQDEYGKFIEGIAEKTEDILKSHSRTVSSPYVANLVMRNIGGKYLVKLSIIESKNPELYNTGERVYESKGGFSYISPDGWQVQPSNFSKFMITYGSRTNKFSPNISFTQEADNRSLEQYVIDSIELLKNSEDILIEVIEEPTNFSTNEEVQGFRITYLLDSSGSKIKVRQYFFRNNRYITTASCGALLEDSYDRIFDECLKTISFK